MNETPPKLPGAARADQSRFWLALFAPALTALAGILIGQLRGDAFLSLSMSIGVGNILVGTVASGYCGTWLARRFCQNPTTRALATLGFTLVIWVVNFSIVAAGCVFSVAGHSK